MEAEAYSILLQENEPCIVAVVVSELEDETIGTARPTTAPGRRIRSVHLLQESQSQSAEQHANVLGGLSRSPASLCITVRDAVLGTLEAKVSRQSLETTGNIMEMLGD